MTDSISEGASLYPLSHGQRSLWFMQRLAPEGAAYNFAHAARIITELDVATLHRVIRKLVERHPALRTTFPVHDGEPVQRISDRAEFHFQMEDTSQWSEAQLKGRLAEEVYRPFDLARGPLLRVFLFTRSMREHIILLATHHIVADLWSVAVIMSEWGALYLAESSGVPVELAPLPAQYTDYVRKQNESLAGPEGERLWAYWRKRLAGAPPILNLPTDRPRPPVQTDRADSRTLRLGRAVSQGLKTLARAHGATTYMTLLAAFQALLHRYTGQEDILVASPMIGRGREAANLVGYFVNPVVLRADFSGDPTFSSFLDQARQTALEAFEHSAYPFPVLIERLQPARDPSRPPLVQVVFTWQQTTRVISNQAMAPFAVGESGRGMMELGNLQFESMSLEQRVAPFELMLLMAEAGDELVATIDYNTKLFDGETIARTLGNFQTLLEGIVADPERRISDLPLLTAVERQQLLVDWNATAAAYPQDQRIHHLFETQVERTPDAIAVAFEGAELSYRALNQRANQLAHYLQKRGVGPEALVGICLDRSLEMIVGVLAVLKAGGAYVPIDPTHPSENLAFMLEDSQALLLLTQVHLAPGLPTLQAEVQRFSHERSGKQTTGSTGKHGEKPNTVDPRDPRDPRGWNLPNIHLKTAVVRLDEDWPVIAAEPDSNPASGAAAENLAYVIYTSGSTGRPKGALLQHRGLCNLVTAQTSAFGVDARSRVLQFASFSFDASVSEIFMALATGASLRLARRDNLLSMSALLQLLRDQITTVTLPPSLLAMLSPVSLPTLETVISAGESCSWEIFARWAEGRRFFNAYGPTEATIGPTYCELREMVAGAREAPIGRPIANMRIYLLNRRLQPAPIGAPGEIYIGGIGLARGYLNRPELTAEKFIPNPFGQEPGARLYRTGDLARYLPDGNLEFLGRLDHQVKIRGHRIELEEIEAKLKQHPALREAIVVAREDEPDNKCLAAYVIPQERKHLELWPSVAEYFVYDDLLYYAMTHDERRNKSYRAAIDRSVKDKVVLDIGTGKDAILARFCVEAGARKVYAVELLEESYQKAKACIQKLGLENKITLIHGDVTKSQLPEKVDVCVSEIVGAIGGSEGASVILNDAWRRLKDNGVMIPERSVTRIAAVSLPDEELFAHPGFTKLTGEYVEKIFTQVGYKFDLRVCLKGLTTSDLISNIEIFEDLDFTGYTSPEYRRELSLNITKDARMDGFLVWLRLYTMPNEVIDILEQEHCWLPVYFPVFHPGIEVSEGDTIEATVSATLCQNRLNPDYRVTGKLIRKNGAIVDFDYTSYHYKQAYRQNSFYKSLFAEDAIKIIAHQQSRVSSQELRAYLKERLPDYMIPSAFVTLEALALTPNGKVDRAALPSPEKTRPELGAGYMTPRNKMEQALVEVWQKVLGIERVGVHDNFFDLGGHSLMLAKAHSQMQEVFDRELPMIELFKYPTISALAEYLSRPHEEDGGQPSFQKSRERAMEQRDAINLG